MSTTVPDSETEREVRLYRGLLVFVGSVYLVWWLAVHVILPQAFNPFWSRLLVVLWIWGVAAASYPSHLIREHLWFTLVVLPSDNIKV